MVIVHKKQAIKLSVLSYILIIHPYTKIVKSLLSFGNIFIFRPGHEKFGKAKKNMAMLGNGCARYSPI